MDKYQKLYNEHPEYQALRSASGPVFEKYVKDVKHWKLKYLHSLIESSGTASEILKVAEIGCATGVLLNHFMKDREGVSKIGIDISDLNISSAKEFYPHISFHAESFEDFVRAHITETSLDLVIMSDVLEHVEEDVGLLKLAGSHSKYVIINLPIEKVPEYAEREYGIDDIEGHLRAYSVSDAERMCKEAGMEIISSTVKRYVEEPVFRSYLLEKLIEREEDKASALLKYSEELNEIGIHSSDYKMNYFALLKRARNE